MKKLFSIVILIASLQIQAQKKQKVGLVLSGGGASGMAHVGVLKAIEEENIPIDYIVGTSVGALIGGLYASGYSPQEIEAIVTAEKFRNSANGLIEREYLFYLKKREEKAGMISWNFELDSTAGKNLPTNFINPTAVDFGLMSLFAQAEAQAHGNFDSLFIPFRCLAANITKRTQTVLSSGNLATSIRASMTYPFYISPLEINGDVLFDGGLYNNFPADVMCEEFNPDYIIASNVSTQVDDPDPDNLISQVKSMLIRNSDFELTCAKGVIVNSDVADISTFDFYHNKDAIQRGYDSFKKQAKQVVSDLKELTSQTNNIADKRLEFRKSSPELLFGSFNPQGIHPNQTKYFIRRLELNEERISFDQVESESMKLASDEKIKSIYPTAKYNEETNRFDLRLDFKKEKAFKASFGGVVSTKPFSTGFFQLDWRNVRATSLQAHGNIYFGSFYSSAEGGLRWDIPFDIPFYIQSNFTINQFDYFNGRSTFIEENDPPYIIESERYWEGLIGLPVLTKGKISLGASYMWQNFEYYQTDNFERGDTSDITDFEGFSTFVQYDFNSLNRRMYASKGSMLQFGLRFINGKERTKPGSTALLKDEIANDHSWLTIQLKYDKYFFERGNFRLGTSIHGVYSDLPFFQNYTATILSAPSYNPLPENLTLFQDQYRALSFLGGGLKTIYNIRDQVDFRLEAYLFQPYESIERNNMGEARLGAEVARRDYIGTFTTVYHSRVGPLAASLNYFNDSSPELSFLLHFGYVIFNKRARQ